MRISEFQEPPISHVRELLTERLVVRINVAQLRITTMPLSKSIEHLKLIRLALSKEIELWISEHTRDSAWAISVLAQLWPEEASKVM